ncbi:flagellar hook-length control protein FliK [Acidisoma silvae]|uniref:Flagellar hook-length control protein FliK n=1 Tax=Acidisoma silvae TaxID=2802396 RepID=A0A963YQR4_9PROT|nr:flagellar hook-length control protein FliK [Acidisoma silvae]MCB8874914.1 flagellar hook-length control protein FliK [Acidisoma silvae]
MTMVHQAMPVAAGQAAAGQAARAQPETIRPALWDSALSQAVMRKIGVLDKHGPAAASFALADQTAAESTIDNATNITSVLAAMSPVSANTGPDEPLAQKDRTANAPDTHPSAVMAAVPAQVADSVGASSTTAVAAKMTTATAATTKAADLPSVAKPAAHATASADKAASADTDTDPAPPQPSLAGAPRAEAAISTKLTGNPNPPQPHMPASNTPLRLARTDDSPGDTAPPAAAAVTSSPSLVVASAVPLAHDLHTVPAKAPIPSGSDTSFLPASALPAAVVTVARSGHASAVLRLDPPGLGSLSIHVTHASDATVNLVFLPSNAQTAQILTDSMDHLRQAMAGAGLSLGQAQIDHGSAQSQAQDQGQKGADRAAGPATEKIAPASPAANGARAIA